MNKPELITKMTEFGSNSKVEAERNLNAFFSVLEYCAENKEDLKLVGYFNMEIKDQQARTFRNPSTGEKIEKPAKKVAKLKIGKVLKELVK
jgi:DNA-binding protein HU-beta